MKALTLTQPWAHLVAVGAKRVETRSWPTPYRGPLAIHAAQGWGEPDRRFAAAAWGYLSAIGEVDAEEVSLLSWMAAIDGERGCVLGTIDLANVVTTDGELFTTHEWSPRERLFGDFSAGRHAWILNGPFCPVARRTPAKGALGLWEW